MLKNAAVAVLLIIAAVGSATTVVQAQSAGEVEVRITAQRLEDGRTEFALQQREGDGWSERIAPRARFLPAEPPIDRWLFSTPVTVGAPDMLQTEGGGGVEVRITAQRLEDGRTEFAIEQREGDGWSERIAPRARFLPAEPPVDRWLFSTPVTVGAPTPASADRAALVTLYNATNGPNWTNNTNWLSDTPLDQWHGVSTDGDGRVVTLDLYANQLSGAIPPELGNLANLAGLSLAGNQLSGAIPSELGNLANLLGLSLADNQLSGAIPPELGNLANLLGLSLADNQLSGSIPSELGNLANLLGLSLDNNQLSGPMPSELGNLANLLGLSLDNNQLSGSIPPELGNLANLQELHLRHNQLSGPIPSELGNLVNLRVLWLNNNQLSGVIPSELGNLANLSLLRLHANRLSGCIPGALQAQLTDSPDRDLPFCQ